MADRRVVLSLDAFEHAAEVLEATRRQPLARGLLEAREGVAALRAVQVTRALRPSHDDETPVVVGVVVHSVQVFTSSWPARASQYSRPSSGVAAGKPLKSRTLSQQSGSQ